jgi:hypothetical protein
MSFINIRFFNWGSKKEEAFLVNPDQIGSLYVEIVSLGNEYKGKFDYKVKGIPNFENIYMNSSQLSDLEKKLGVKIPINEK